MYREQLYITPATPTDDAVHPPWLLGNSASNVMACEWEGEGRCVFMCGVDYWRREEGRERGGEGGRKSHF